MRYILPMRLSKPPTMIAQWWLAESYRAPSHCEVVSLARSILVVYTALCGLGYPARIPSIRRVFLFSALNARSKRQVPSRGLGSTHPVLDRMDGFRLVNTPFAVGSRTERCFLGAIGLSGLVLVIPHLTLSLCLASPAACFRLLWDNLNQLMYLYRAPT
jgi:hypothetical protein